MLDSVLKIMCAVFFGYTMVILWGIYWQQLMLKVEAIKSNMMLQTLVEVKTKEVQMMLRVQEIVKENEKKA